MSGPAGSPPNPLHQGYGTDSNARQMLGIAGSNPTGMGQGGVNMPMFNGSLDQNSSIGYGNAPWIGGYSWNGDRNGWTNPSPPILPRPVDQQMPNTPGPDRQRLMQALRGIR